jgi:hypothetical protein
MATEPGPWTLVLDMLGRPLTANGQHKRHPVAATRDRQPWRDCALNLALAQRIPRLERIAVTVQARYCTRRSPADIDASAPSVKGVLDGLVLAGVIPDDCPPFVASLTYLDPLLGTGLRDALIVTVEAAS